MNDKHDNRPIANTWWCAPTFLGVVTASGPDAAKFLQGQVTCDIRELADQVTRLGAQCDLKGRVLTNFRAMQINPHLIALCMASELIEKTINSLNKYIVFSKAKLEDSSAQFAIIGLYGEQAQTLAMKYFPSTPENPGAWREHQGSYIIKLTANRYECWMKPEGAAVLKSLISPYAEEAESDRWKLLDIRDGIGWITSSTRELFTPHALNYPLIDAVNFRKGCYTGQEIVARMHYRGKIKRYMYRFELLSESLPIPGTKIVSLGTEQGVGEVVMAASAGSGKIELLGSVTNEQAHDICLINNSQKLKRLSLPYAITCDDAPSN